MRAAITIFLFFIAGTCSSQSIPGYLGKRFVIGYSNYFMLGFKGPGPINSEPADVYSPTLNNAHCLNSEYVLKKNKMLCLSGQYIRTGVAYDDGTTNGTFFGDMFGSESETPYPGGRKYVGNFSKPALLQSFNIGLGFKAFKTGFIPPVGKYRKFEVVLLFEKIKYDCENFAEYDYNSYYNDVYIKSKLGTGEYSYRNISFAYTMGQQRILSEKIVLDYGIRFAYTPALNIITLAAGSEYTTSVVSYFRRESNLRMARQQLINFHLGIGFLAF